MEQFQTIDIMSAFKNEPPPIDFVLPGLLAGTVGALLAAPRHNVSMFALQLACAVASDNPHANTTNLPVTRHGPVLYVNFENSVQEIHRRLHTIGKLFDSETKESISNSLMLEILNEADNNELNTDFRDNLLSLSAGMRLIVIDACRSAHALADYESMGQLITHLEYVARHTGAGILLVANISTTTVNEKTSAKPLEAAITTLINNTSVCYNLVSIDTREAGHLQDQNGIAISEQRAKFFVRLAQIEPKFDEMQETRWFEQTTDGILSPITRTPRSCRTRTNFGKRQRDYI